MYTYIIFVVLLAHGIQAQVPFLGKCPNVKDIQENFDVNRFLGNWISIERYFAAFELGMKCGEAVYSLDQNGTFLLHNQMTGKYSNNKYHMEGYATPAGDHGEGKLLIHFTYPLPVNGPYWILETDYDSYAVIWSCIQAIGVNFQLAWIMTRDRNYPQESMDKARAVFDRNNLTRKILNKMDQANCPKYD